MADRSLDRHSGTPSWRVVEGDCIEQMAAMPEASVDAVVCDPPYGLGFMGKEWDAPGGTGDFPMRRTTAANTVNTGASRQGGRQRSTVDFAKRQARDARKFQEWCEAWGSEALRVLKPGGHLLAFGGTRTYHRLTSGIEDAGFEVRDCVLWLYGSGFPKSLDVSKAIDKGAGHWRGRAGGVESENGSMGGPNYERTPKGDPVTAAAAAAGWGTALKPAHEPVVLARKSTVGTVAANFMEHGTGALNIDGCRLDTGGEVLSAPQSDPSKRQGEVGRALQAASDAERNQEAQRASIERLNTLGRWPANVALDEEAATMLDTQAGESVSRIGKPRTGANGEGWGMTATGTEYDDQGGPSRFFYVAKPDADERQAGLGGEVSLFAPADVPDRNDHPTVKPIELMRWLCRLVTPNGGTVLDPFTGSGTTGCAAALEGFHFIGIEREPDYARIARARLAHWALGEAA